MKHETRFVDGNVFVLEEYCSMKYLAIKKRDIWRAKGYFCHVIPVKRNHVRTYGVYVCYNPKSSAESSAETIQP